MTEKYTLFLSISYCTQDVGQFCKHMNYCTVIFAMLASFPTVVSHRVVLSVCSRQ